MFADKHYANIVPVRRGGSNAMMFESTSLVISSRLSISENPNAKISQI
jgi:hypothetical protein